MVKAEDLKVNDKLPQGWVNCMLDDLLTTIQSGSRPRGGVKGITDGIPSLGGEHLTYNGGFNFSSIRYVPESFANQMTRGNIQEEDILIVKDGATTGKTAYVDKTFPFKKAVINEHLFICRASKLIDSKYLFYYLISKQGQDQILTNFQGSAQGGINLSFAPNTEVILPPLNEQKRIVAKLEKLLAKVNESCDRLSRIPTILKRFRQSVLASACSGRLTADWRKSHPDMKEKWQQLTLKELLSEPLANGHSVVDAKDKEKCFPVLRLTCLKSMRIDLNERKMGAWTEEEANKFLIKEDDFFVARGNGSLNLVGRGGLVNCCPDKVAYPDTLIRVRVKKEIMSPKFLSLVWDSSVVREQVQKSARTTAGIHKINQQSMRQFMLPIPPLEEQKEIVRRVEALLRKCDLIEQRYLKAKAYTDKLTQSILAKAFRGELVQQDPNDEPAEVLLERIREEKTLTEKSSKGKKTSKRKTT